MLYYEELTEEMAAAIRRDRERGITPAVGTPDAAALRRTPDAADKTDLLRSPFVRDVDRILHCPFYNR